MKLPWVSRWQYEKSVAHYEALFNRECSLRQMVEILYFKYAKEIRAAHKGIARLKRKIKQLEQVRKELEGEK